MYLPHGTYRVKINCLAESRQNVNASRHVTYRERNPWIPYAELLEKPLPDRMRYVRGNITTEEGGPELTQPEFVAAVGGGLKSGHHAVVRWEKHGQQPRIETREALARITPYPADAFLREPGAGVSLASIDARLQSLEGDLAKLTTLLEEALGLLRASPRRASQGSGSQRKAS